MRRRAFITLLGGAAAWPLAVRAQQPPMPVVGLLDSVGDTDILPTFRKGLSELGFTVGHNLVLDVRSTDQYDRLPALAADLVLGRPAVLVALDGPSARVVKAATTTIPIVFSIGGDPVELGFVTNIARPGGNITGTTFFTAQLLQKQVGLMHELLPKARAFGVLVNPQNPRAIADLASTRAAAGTFGIEIHAANVVAKSDFEGALAALQSKHTDALVILGDPLTMRERASLADLTSRYAVPTMMYTRQFPEIGGLISYGASIVDANRQAGHYVGRILKGEKPGDLPVLQPTKIELVINLKTARALSLEIPPNLLALADEVFE
jgi:putative tryptophan/tyrosine transport system substrate-binding protein